MQLKCSPPHWKNFQNEIVRNTFRPFNPRNGADIDTEIQKFTMDHKNALDNTGKWNEKTGENFSDEIRNQTQIRNRLKKISQLTKDPVIKICTTEHTRTCANSTNRPMRKGKLKKLLV
ncbi:hypothetical protein AVEN_236690-1 [Araneus ventricosus]|uniref:Uncharacterized protein n=1 Tax=Araneus ventricosus TaxID=182803 RepID=A0A4Y2EV07_ARAVE|nr:hypothetical protein AVEN_266331-1 [Araneus ventricosus]GBM88793.1 hypothetical protein AVEN_111559-1 [Araneus ventricosus]GBM88802.1 hypothetical protein AVEN_137638-1 [Araneus ventricosus]GBM88847.1 hypothetical protein AVEN_274815-1 [Araneus ventricosus]GBM88864.1 hypothetical protein AVEN_236690-1 [Araneus ventricosus]